MATAITTIGRAPRCTVGLGGHRWQRIATRAAGGTRWVAVDACACGVHRHTVTPGPGEPDGERGRRWYSIPEDHPAAVARR